jgi:hypothetical protein
MKKFKDFYNLTENTGDKAYALSPKAVFSQSGTHLPPPPSGYTALPSNLVIPTPTPTSTVSPFSGKMLPIDFKIKVQDAIKIANGQWQKDEKIVGAVEAIAGITSFAVTNIPRLSILGSGMADVGKLVALSQLISFVITNFIKPGARKLLVQVAGLDELKQINEKEYKLLRFQLDKNTDQPLVSTMTPISKKLEQIAATMTQSGDNVTDDHWKHGGYLYRFADPSDVDKIAEMFRRNERSNKFDTIMNGLIPLTAASSIILPVYLSIKASDKRNAEEGAKIRALNPKAFNPQTPQEKADEAQAKQNRRNKYR